MLSTRRRPLLISIAVVVKPPATADLVSIAVVLEPPAHVSVIMSASIRIFVVIIP
jgi:hypothetical protein